MVSFLEHYSIRTDQTISWSAQKYPLPNTQKLMLEQDVKAKLKFGILKYTSEIPLAASHMVPKRERTLVDLSRNSVYIAQA
jgi:hypothetical protein